MFYVLCVKLVFMQKCEKNLFYTLLSKKISGILSIIFFTVNKTRRWRSRKNGECENAPIQFLRLPKNRQTKRASICNAQSANE